MPAQVFLTFLPVRPRASSGARRLCLRLTLRVCARAQAKLAEMNDELQELLTKSEVLGEQGDVDDAQAAAAQADGLRVRARSTLILPLTLLYTWGLAEGVPKQAGLPAARDARWGWKVTAPRSSPHG